jgi:hypothetical protein
MIVAPPDHLHLSFFALQAFGRSDTADAFGEAIGA